MTATALADLELPNFDYLDPELRGERFHSAMAELAEQGWLATMPLGCVALDREAGEFFLRSRSVTFPGMKIAEIFGIDDGPLLEEIRRNILHVNGDDHRAPARPRQPLLHPARGRALAPGHARLPRRRSGTPSNGRTSTTSWRRSPSPTPRR